ncbi:hypothetical protein SuNHUV7_02600 (plasmid) [Pseudoseohaeicola sp. NH-UV-7]|uniref:hypothetical protein n=1 Tax=Sulfitobacter sp. TBRI5 TaxID=2989732 RepID=UPI003A6FF957
MEDGGRPEASSAEALIKRCVSVDLEVDPKTNRIQSFAGVRSGFDRAFVYTRGDLSQALDSLDAFAETAEFVLAHNLIAFDAKQLEAAKPDLQLLKKPMIDTLWLNPLAFPRNPYAGRDRSIRWVG